MKKIVCCILLIIMTWSLAGCGGGTPAASKKLTVVAAYGNKEKIFAAFTQATGITVDFLDMSSGEVLARTQAEKGKPLADVWFGGGLDSFLAAKNNGVLAQYRSKEQAAIPAEFRDPDGYWYGVSLVMVGIMANKDVLKQNNLTAPATWAELANPRYVGEVLFPNPNISGTSYAFVSGMLQTKGAAAGWSYLETLAKNVPYFSKRGGEPPQKVAAGEAALGVVPMSGEFFALKQKAPIEVYFPADGIPWVPAGLAIFKNAKNEANAQIFVDWALSAAGQAVICAADPRVMTRTDMPVPESLPAFSPAMLMKIDLAAFGADRQSILAEWDKRMVKK